MKKLNRTRQCDLCPWRVDVDPHDIPNGYSEDRHEALTKTIAEPGDLSAVNVAELHVLACHETHEAMCVGWLIQQLGDGNNIALRMRMRGCENLQNVKLIGEQHRTFEDTLP